MTPAQKNEIKIKRGHLKQQKSEMNSLWCSALYKLSIANQVHELIVLEYFCYKKILNLMQNSRNTMLLHNEEVEQ